MLPTLILGKGYEVTRDAPELFAEGQPEFDLCLNLSQCAGFRFFGCMGIFTIDGKQFAVDVDALLMDIDTPASRTPFIMLQPRTTSYPAVYVHRDQIAEITWTNEELTKARVRLAVQGGNDSIIHEVCHPDCIGQLKELCNNPERYRTDKEYRELEAQGLWPPNRQTPRLEKGSQAEK